MAERRKFVVELAKGLTRDEKGRILCVIGSTSKEYLDLPSVSSSKDPVREISYRVRLLQCELNRRRGAIKANPELTMDMAWIRETDSVFNNLLHGCTVQELARHLPNDLALEVRSFWSRAQRAANGRIPPPSVDEQERIIAQIDAWATLRPYIDDSKNQRDSKGRGAPVAGAATTAEGVGEILIGWKEIVAILFPKAVGKAKSRNLIDQIRRANAGMKGPIRTVGHRAQVHRQKLMRWWNALEDRAEAARASHKSVDANRKSLADRAGAEHAGLGMHFEQRPNSHGISR